MGFVEGLRTRWEDDQFALGSYSSFGKDSSPGDARELGRSVAGRLWMVGEYCHTEFIGGAHAAWITGINAAKEINSKC